MRSPRARIFEFPAFELHLFVPLFAKSTFLSRGERPLVRLDPFAITAVFQTPRLSLLFNWPAYGLFFLSIDPSVPVHQHGKMFIDCKCSSNHYSRRVIRNLLSSSSDISRSGFFASVVGLGRPTKGSLDRLILSDKRSDI